MPSATNELRDAMTKRFGGIDDGPPMKFLEDAGYHLTDQWMWIPKPGVFGYDDMTQDEYDCLAFLVQEWDMDGLVEPPPESSDTSSS